MNRTEIRNKQQKWRDENRSSLRRREQAWRDANPGHKDKYNKSYMSKEENRIRNNEKTKQYYRDLKVRVIKKYSDGEPKCACCGEGEIIFLTIDHINEDGARHRRELKRASINSWLDKQPRLPGFQVLCFNCNCAKGFFGECPHKRK